MMGLKPSFFIDEAALKQKFYDNARKFHPDVNVREGDSETATQVAELAALNNKAYKTLSTFHGRVAYMLERAGLAGENLKHSLDPDFLMQVMELSEQVDELGSVASPEKFNHVNGEVLRIEQEINEALINEAGNWEQADEDRKPAVLNDLSIIWARYKYLLRLQEGLATFAAR